jgi:hypothetical protein
MKNKAGIISGFVLGTGGFLLLFKLIFLVNIPPEDEIPPGIVVIASVLNGLLFAFAGYLIQNYFGRKGTSPNPS